MKKQLVRLVRQSPAMIVAMLALFVALTGTAVATTSALITGNQIKNSSITGLDVKNKSLTPRDFRGSVRGPRGLRGLPGAAGATGATGATGAIGAKGDKGDPGDAVAYALITPSGGVNATYSKGITAAMVTKPAATTGVYCFSGLSFTPKSIVASGDNIGPTLDTLAAGAINGAGGNFNPPNCAGLQARVMTFGAVGAGAADNRAFYVWFED